MSQEPFIPAPTKAPVSFDAFAAIDIRLGTIEAVTDVPSSRKLVALTVAFGDHRRTILAGLKAERSDPGEVVGKQTLFVVNLEPRRMAGVVSEGMLLDVGYADGLAVPEHPLPDGARAG
jgi:tRNA-binding protein